MTQHSTTSTGYLKSLLIIFLGLLIGQILLLVVTFLVNYTDNKVPDHTEFSRIFLYVILIAGISSATVGHFYFNKRLQEIKKGTDLKQKLIDYRKTLIVNCALLEAPILFALVLNLITANIIFPGIAFVLMLVFLRLLPTKNKIVEDLELNPAESKELETIESI